MPISIHALREEGDFLGLSVRYDKLISIHALREEGDRFFNLFLHLLIEFLSTPSARRATAYSGYGNTGCKISIHALREEGDPHHRGQRPREAISIHALREEGDSKNRDKISIFL